jgi:hypothetical protein
MTGAKCRDHNGTESWACDGCDCTARLEERLNKTGKSFMESLRSGEVRLIKPQQRAGSGHAKQVEPAVCGAGYLRTDYTNEP